METTTHSTSEGDVLAATDHNHDHAHPQLTFERRTIRTLLSFERRRLAMQRTELAMEEHRLAMQRESMVAHDAHRAASSKALLELVQLAVPVVASFFDAANEDAPLDEDALNAAIADVAGEFPDLKETLEGRARARREAETRRAAVG